MSEPTEREDAASEREHVERVLRDRARALARPLVGEQIEATADLVTLELDGRTYAIDATLVREVCAVRELTPLPTAPAFVLGITNIRGKIIAVLDLGVVLAGEAVGKPSGRAIVVEIGGIEIGVDARSCGVARVPYRRLQPASAAEQGRYLKLVGGDDLGVLDLARIIADTRHTAASLASEAGQ